MEDHNGSLQERVGNRAGRLFGLKAAGTTVRTEVIAGLAVFLTMSYIIFLQPAILSGSTSGIDTGMDYGSVLTATCIAAALATLIMALYARYPIAQAPGMGENFFFVFSVIPAASGLASVQAGETQAWQVALGAVFISGVLFLLLSVLGVREKLMNSISPAMKCGIAVGIGLFIALLGMQYAGLVTSVPGAALTMNTDFGNPDTWVFFFGLILTVALMVRKVPGAIFWGILGAAGFTLLLHAVLSNEVYRETRLFTMFTPADRAVSAPPAVSPTFLKMDIAGALNLTMLPFMVVLLVMDVFDTMGTLVGVGTRAGFIVNDRMPRLEKAMLSDAVGTVAGAALGTSTVTSFIESTVGVEEGGRTGLTAVTVAVLFLSALFFAPVFAMVGSYPPITAPALLVVGAMMLQNIRELDWKDPSETIPAFLVITGIPFTCSIGDGLALGFISYPLIKLASGRGREVGWFSYLMAAILTLYFVFVRNAV